MHRSFVPALSPNVYGLAWVALIIGQLILAVWATPFVGDSAVRIPLWVAGAGVVALQGAKIVPTLGRLRALGRPAEHALLAAVPLVSIGLAVSLLRARPTEMDLAMSNQEQSARTSAFGAVVKGFRAMMGAPAVTLGALAIPGLYFALVEGLVIPWFRTVVAETEPANLMTGTAGAVGATHILVFQVMLAMFGVVGLWTILQLFKRKSATRVSWMPSLLALPLALCAVGAWPYMAQNFGATAAPGLFAAGLFMAWTVFGSGVLNTLFVALGYDLRTHGSVDMKRAMAFWRERWLHGMAVHGAMMTLIFIGVQALLFPGWFYALLTAFAVPIAMMHPKAPPFRRARKLAKGSWIPIFLVLAIGGVSAAALDLLSIAAVDYVQVLRTGVSSFANEGEASSIGTVIGGWATLRAMPAAFPVSPLAAGIGGVLSAIVPAAVSAGLVWMYGERLAQAVSESAAKEAKKAE